MGKGWIDDEKTERKERGKEREGLLVEWHRLVCGTSKGNGSVISLLPDLGVLRYETQIARTLPIRN